MTTKRPTPPMIAEFDLPDTMRMRPLRNSTVGEAEFRQAMATLASSVHVVTARRGDEMVGRTVTSVMSLSAQPPAILISIDIVSRLADVIAKTGGFSLALLRDDQSDIADAFAGKLAPERRFDVGRWTRWHSGHPKLLGAAMTVDCEVIGSMETGTHVLFAGALIEAETNTKATPLLWHNRNYALPKNSG
ncbi:flavin reductase [Devosia sp. MC532]|nr:flavin reductase [Devosia sp. MC532]